MTEVMGTGKTLGGSAQRPIPSVFAQDAGGPNPLGFYRLDLPMGQLAATGRIRLQMCPEAGPFPPGGVLVLPYQVPLPTLETLEAERACRLTVVDKDDDVLGMTLKEMYVLRPLYFDSEEAERQHGILYGAIEQLMEKHGKNTRARDVLEPVNIAEILRLWPRAWALRGGGDPFQAHLEAIAGVGDVWGQWERCAIRALKGAANRAEAETVARTLTPYGVYERQLRLADLLTVTTSALAARYAQYSDHIAVLPNCIDLTHPCYRTRRTRHTGVVLGWAGHSSHRDDLAILQQPLARLMEEYDGEEGRPLVRLMLGGDPAAWKVLAAAIPAAETFADEVASFMEPGPDERGFRTLESRCGRFLYSSWTDDVASVGGMYSRTDIGLVPLIYNTPINICKSDIKAVEMAGMGVPCVASPAPAYVECRGRAGTGAIVLEDNLGWLAALRPLIEDADLRKRMSREARAFAETRSIERYAAKWMEAYEEAARRTGKVLAA